MLFINIDVNASNTDFSKASYSIKGITDTSQTMASIQIDGVKFDWANYGYYAYISNNKNDVPEIIPDVSIDNVSSIEIIDPTGKIFENGFSIAKYLEKSGDIYVTLYELTSEYGLKKATEPTKINSPIFGVHFISLGSRIKAGFSTTGDTITLFVPHGYYAERKVNYKIGQITDKELLLSIKNGESKAINNLLEYSKSANNSKTGTLSVGLLETTIIDSLDLKDSQYYYVYLELDNENGKYYDVEDVWIYQASISEDGKKYLLRYGDKNEFSWNIEEENIPTTDKETQEETVKNPKTGINLGYGVLILIVLISGIAYLLIRKQSKFAKHN